METFNYRNGGLMDCFESVDKVIKGKLERIGIENYRALLIDGDQVNGKTAPYMGDWKMSYYVTMVASSTIDKLNGFNWVDFRALSENEKDASDMYLELIAFKCLADSRCAGIDVITSDQALNKWICRVASLLNKRQSVVTHTSWEGFKMVVTGLIDAVELRKMKSDAVLAKMIHTVANKVTNGSNVEEIVKSRDIVDIYAANAPRVHIPASPPAFYSLRREMNESDWKVVNGAHLVSLLDGSIGLVRERPEKKWGFPGGKPEGDETLPKALVREIKEETGNRFDLYGTERWYMSEEIDEKSKTIWRCNFIVTDKVMMPNLCYFNPRHKCMRDDVEPYVFRVLNQYFTVCDKCGWWRLRDGSKCCESI